MYFMKNLSMAILAGGALAMATSASASVLYSTSFEDPPYIAGQGIGGIDNWFNGSGSGNSQTVSTDIAYSGNQSLKWDNTGTFQSFYSVRRALPAYDGPIAASIRLYIDPGTIQPNRLYGLYFGSSPTSTLGGTVLGLTIAGDGVVRAGTTWSSTYSGAGIGSAPQGGFLGQWLEIVLTYDPDTLLKTATIYGDNWSVGFSGTGGAAPLNLNIGSDYFATTDRAGIGYFDDLIIQQLPAPGALALLGLAGLVGTRRRR
jgi:hypothetical protein